MVTPGGPTNIGIGVTKGDISYICGQICLQLKINFDKAVNVNAFLLTQTDEVLIEMGFIQGEIDTIKSALADLAYMKETAFNSSPHVKLLYGMGI